MKDQANCDTLADFWWAGVHAVGGRASTAHYLADSVLEPPTRILAIGKAAEEMYLAAAARFGDAAPCLLVTKHGHATQIQGENVIEAGHPTPDDHSLRAGRAALDFVKAAGPEERLLVLASGGSSAIAELPEAGLTLEDIIRKNDALLSSGRNIGEVNATRAQASQIKGGKLLSHFRGAAITVLGISDVEGDTIEVIGSGIAAGASVQGASYDCHIIASNEIARTAVVDAAKAAGHDVISNQETLYKDVGAAASDIATSLDTDKRGVWIWGGEPTVTLPDNPGRGGRNQELALRVAHLIRGMENTTVFVAGTDGTDGPTDAAGACVTGATWDVAPGASTALERADSWTWFKETGGLFVTGPTGTNVMDLVIAIKT